MPGLSSIGSVSGLPFKECGFFDVRPNLTFRGVISGAKGIVYGGALVYVTGTYFQGYYGGNATQILIKALKKCRILVYKVALGASDTP